jgi:hypothetical protein
VAGESVKARPRRLADLARDARASFGTRFGGPLGGREIAGDGAIALRRRRLPRHALVEFELGRGLTEEVPVLHGLGNILPGRWPAGCCDRQWLGGLADVVETPRHPGGLGDEGPLSVGLLPLRFGEWMSAPGR